MCQICAKNSAVSKPEEAKPSLGQKFLGTAEALEAAWAQKTIKPTVFLAPGTAWGPKNYKTHCFGTNLGPKSIPGAVPDATGRRPGATGRRPGSTGSDGDALLVSDNHCTGDLGGFWLRPGAASAS